MSAECGDTQWRQRVVRVTGNKPLVGLAIKWVTTSRGHPDLNRGPLDLQSNALPLSYAPTRLGLYNTHCKPLWPLLPFTLLTHVPLELGHPHARPCSQAAMTTSPHLSTTSSAE